MKRLLSLLVVIAMMVSLMPNVFATKEEVDFDELTGRLVVLEDIESFDVALAAESDGMIYQWTPYANVNLSLSWTAPEGTAIQVVMTQGEQTVTGTESVAMDVWADEVVEIEITEAAAQAAEFTVSGVAAAVPGSDEYNPVFLSEQESTVTAEGTTFSGNTTWFGGYFGGTDLTVTGEGEFNVIYAGETYAAADGVVTIEGLVAMGRMPVTFAIDTKGEYTIKFEYPVGSAMNPEILFRPNYIAVDIAAGNDQGYYYKWSTVDAGTLVLTCPTVEGVAYNVILTNQTTYAQAWLSDSTDGTVAIEMGAGDEVVIQVAAEPDSTWNYPALQTAITGNFIYPAGTQSNPEVLTSIESINVNVAEGNNQGYFYSWTATETGTLVLTPAIEGVEYEVNMTNMSTYAQVWLQDSTDGTIALEVTAGDQVVIQVAGLPDASWNYPAVVGTIAGELVLPAPSLVITAQPESLTRLPGEAASFTVVAEGEGLTYKWYYRNAGETSWRATSLSGYNTATLNVSNSVVGATHNGRQYMCKITDAAGQVVETEPATLTVIYMISDAKSQGVQIGETAVFTVKHSDPGATYRWQYKGNTSASTWANTSATGNKTDTLQVVAKATNNGYMYRCNITLADGTVITSKEVYLNVTEDAAVITANPVDASAVCGDYATFSIAAEGDGLVYQWQFYNPAVGVWTNTKGSGYSTNTLKVKTNNFNSGYMYRCVVKTYNGVSGGVTLWNRTYTDAATLTVLPAADILEELPETVTVKVGEQAVFHIGADGEALTYQWQWAKFKGNWKNTTMSGATTDTLTTNAATAEMNGRYYRVIITNAYGGKYESAAVQLFVEE